MLEVTIYALLALVTVGVVAWSVRSFMTGEKGPMMSPDEAHKVRMQERWAKEDAERTARERGESTP